MSLTNVLSERELDSAREYLSSGSRTTYRKRRDTFTNGISLFLRHFIENEGQSGKKRIFAIDSSELFPQPQGEHNPDVAFSFSPFLVDNESSSSAINLSISRLDELIRYELLFSKHQTLLLDAHSEEIVNLRSRKKVNIPQLLAPNEPISTESLDLILKLLRSSDSEAQYHQLWQSLVNDFFPWLQENSIRHIQKEILHFDLIDTFLNDSRHCYLRSMDLMSKNGISVDKSVEYWFKQLKGSENFDFDGFIEYIGEKNVAEQNRKLVEDLSSLLDHARGPSPANEIDARAISQAHYFNSYLENQGILIEVALVSRTHTMHEVLASLPAHRIRLSVHHPMLVPEIYNIGHKIQGKLGNIFRSARNLMALPKNQFETRETEHSAREEAQIIFRYLSGMISVGSSAGLSKSIGSEEVTGETEGREPVERSELAGRILAELQDSIERGKDPLTRQTWLRIQERTRIFLQELSETKEQKICLSEIVGDPTLPFESYYAVRCIDPYFGPLFHFYVLDLRKYLAQNDRSESANFEAQERELDVNLVVTEFNALLDDHNRKNTGSNFFERGDLEGSSGLRNRLEHTLLVCLILASREYHQIANEIASEALSPLGDLIRKDENPDAPPDYRRDIFLVMRELYLFRHHSERHIALKQSADSPGTSLIDENMSAELNLARAQRDLDYSVFIFERAMFLEGKLEQGLPTSLIESNNSSLTLSMDDLAASANLGEVSDGRSLIAHIGGWVDHFIILIHERMASSDPKSLPFNYFTSIEARGYIWSMAGMAKDASALSTRYKRRSEDTELSPTLRSYSAYLEKRLLQSALLLFAVHFCAHLSPVVSRLLAAPIQTKNERLLAFRDWREWWVRYESINTGLAEEVRMNNLIGDLCRAVDDIQSGKEAQAVRMQLKENLVALLDNFGDRVSMKLLSDLILRQLS